MKYVRVVAIACLFVAAGIISSAGAQGADTAVCGQSKQFMQKKHEGVEKKMGEVYAQLNLTPEQKQKLEDNKKKHRDATKALFEKMKASQEELSQELAKAALDMKKIKSIQEKLKAVQSEMSDSRLESMLEIRKILTPEQFSTFVSLTGKHRYPRQERDSR